MRTKVLSGGANAKTCPNSCCWRQIAPTKGSENFPQKQLKIKINWGNFPWNLGKIFLFIIIIFSPSGEIHPPKKKQSLLHTSQKFRLVLFEFMMIWGFLTPQ
jgi:hypothetical protein